MLHDRICSIIFNIMIFCVIYYITYLYIVSGRRFAAALLPRLFGTNPRSHHKGATGRVQTGDQRLPVLCHCQLGQDMVPVYDMSYNTNFSVSRGVINVLRPCAGRAGGPGYEPSQGPDLGKQRRSRDHPINVPATPKLPNLC